MNNKTKLLLVLGLVVVFAALGPGAGLLADRAAFAEPGTPTPNNGTFQGCGGPGSGGMMGGAGMMGGLGMMGGFDRVTLNKVSELTGIPAADILSQLQQGKSLVEITQETAVTEQDLINAVLAFHKEMMALKVESGYLTQEQADLMLQQMQEVAKTWINSKGQSGVGPGFGPRGGSNGLGINPGPRGGTGMMGGNGGMMSYYR